MYNNNLAVDFPSFSSHVLLDCPDPSHHACSHANLGVDVIQVKFNSPLTHVNLPGNFFIRFPRQNQLQDFQFARGQISSSFLNSIAFCSIMTSPRRSIVNFDESFPPHRGGATANVGVSNWVDFSFHFNDKIQKSP